MVKKQDNITLNIDLGKMKGSGKNSKKTTDSDKTVFIPQFGDYTLKLPPFFAVPNKNGSWRLANPLTEMRNLANRQKELSINIKRANVTEPELENEIPAVTPALGSFSAKDQAKLKAYFEAVKQGKEDEYLFKNKPRGYPAVLYKNAKKAGLKETKEKVYTKNVVKKQPKIPKVKKGETPPVAEKVAEAVPVSPQNKRAEEIIKKLDEYEKTLNSQSTVYKDLLKIQTEMKDMVGEMKQDKTLTSLVKGRFNEVKELFNVINIKLKNEKEQKKEKANTEAMGEEDKAGQKLREAEEEAKLQAEARAFAARARAKMKAKTTGGRLPINLNPLDIIPQGLKAVKDKVVDIAQKVVKGRDGYSPSVTAIIEKFADQEVKSIELHRRVLPTVYTGLLNVLTLGEFNKRIKDQPKDKLFHISMWIKLANGKTVLVEKNEVINMKVNPKKEKEEEVQPAGAVPAGLKFGEMLDKTQKEMGSKYFTYSARDNNCGNYIEAVLKANGMNTKETNDFIGQDAKAILKGYPRIAKALNAITDIAGRANVVMEGGALIPPELRQKYELLTDIDKEVYHNEELLADDEARREWLNLNDNDRRRFREYWNNERTIGSIMDDCSEYSDMSSEEESRDSYGSSGSSGDTEIRSNMSGDGLMGRGFHVATMSNRFHRIPQSESQIKSYLQGSGMRGTGGRFGKPRVEPEEPPELPPYETEQERAETEARQIRILAEREAREIAEAEARQVAEETRRVAKAARRIEEKTRQREQYIKNFKNNLLTEEDISQLRAMSRRSATTREDQIRYVKDITNKKINGDTRLNSREKDILEDYVYEIIDILTDQEVIIREVPTATEIEGNEYREANLIPLLTPGTAFQGYTTARVRPVVSNEPLTGQYVATPQPSLLDRFRRGPPIASVVPEPPARGTGLKKPKFVKGSQEAKDYMKMLRDKRGKK